MHLAAFSAFATVVSCPFTTFRSRLQRPTIKNYSRRFLGSSHCQPQQCPQIVNNCLKYSSFEPPLALLINRCPWWQIMWHHSPCRSSPEHPAQTVENFS
jgi:hypothetical protein